MFAGGSASSSSEESPSEIRYRAVAVFHRFLDDVVEDLEQGEKFASLDDWKEGTEAFLMMVKVGDIRLVERAEKVLQMMGTSYVNLGHKAISAAIGAPTYHMREHLLSIGVRAKADNFVFG